MTRPAKGCLLVLTGSAAVLIVVVLAMTLSKGVDRKTVLEMNLSGSVQEEKDDSLRGRFLQGDVTLISDLRALFEKAGRDDRVVGVMVNIKPFTMGFAKMQELRAAIKAYRSSGKWAVCFLETAGEFTPGNGPYYLASAFDDIMLAPSGNVNLSGIFTESPFLRGTLDKLGIYPDFDAIGKYKNAKNLYTDKEFTAAHREATEALVGDLYKGMVEDIAASRKKKVEEVEAIVDRGPFLAEEAVKEGLVDRLGYYDQFRDAVKERSGGHLNTLNWREYLKRRSGLGVGSSKIAVIHGTGLVVRGRSAYDPEAGWLMGSDSVAGAIRDAREDKSVKAIILRVDSPGGSAVASDVIWRETQLAKKVKPFVVSMSDVAASGGYYVACGADRIVAEPNTITASIGVVYGKLVMKGLYDWVGLSFGTVQRGKNAGFWDELKPWSPEEKDQIYWKFMHQIYDQFVGHVAEGRKMTRDQVDAIAQGRVWSGRRAKDLGLVDELGGFEVAVKAAKDLAKIPADEDVRFEVLPEQPTLWQTIWNSDEADSTGVETALALPRAAQGILTKLRPAAQAALLSGEPMLLAVGEGGEVK
jgi:protease-4